MTRPTGVARDLVHALFTRRDTDDTIAAIFAEHQRARRADIRRAARRRKSERGWS